MRIGMFIRGGATGILFITQLLPSYSQSEDAPSRNLRRPRLSAQTIKDSGFGQENKTAMTEHFLRGPQRAVAACTKRAARNVTIDLVISNNTLYPDGYAYMGNFFDKGQSFLGPLIEAYEGDMIVAKVTNHGSVSQATHWHGLDARNYPYNDGAVGYSMGAMPVSTSYMYNFHASPAGTSWYHGHMEEVMLGGNRGPVVVRKQPCDELHRDLYDGGEVFLTFSEALPWFLNEDKTQALRHISAEEDRENFFLEKHFNYDSVVTDAGQGAASEMPWAGILVNGIGRGIPQNYSSEPKSGVSQQWGEARGKYFTLNVPSGKTQRLRLLNAGGAWSFRVWIEDHPMQVIAVSGTDIEPIKVEGPYGLEISPAERYDVLVKWDKTATDKTHIMHIESTDGCYKSVAFIRYDKAAVTDADVAKADAIQRNRTCDAECYTDAGCDFYKSFALDTNHTVIRNIEANAVPPPNPAKRTAVLVVHEPRTPLFDVNGVEAPALNPPVYQQMMKAGFRVSNLKDAKVMNFLSNYTFKTNEVVDWCVVSYTPDRHPIHLHANRFWVLATGQGDLQSCLNADVDQTLPRVRSDMFVMRYASEEKPQWIKFRAQVAQAGAYPLHCHLQYHVYKAFGVPVVVGPNEAWPNPPADLPSGKYTGTGDGASGIISENGGQ